MHSELFPIASDQETNTIEQWIARNQNLNQHKTYPSIEISYVAIWNKASLDNTRTKAR